MRFTAGSQRGAAAQGVVEQGLHFAPGVGVDQRANLYIGLAAIAHFQGGDTGDELIAELVVDGAMNIEAVDADAGLPGVAELGDQRALDRFIDIGVVKDDKRRVTAEL